MRAPKKPISFSIAGVQLKFSMKEIVDRLTVPAKDEHGDIILKPLFGNGGAGIG